MIKHTSEPWTYFEDFATLPQKRRIAYIESGTKMQVIACIDDYRGGEEPEANAKRIVSCVNALQGIENPEEWIEKAKEALNARD